MPFATIAKPFYFLRHGQTDANAQKLWCGGGWDIDLNKVGSEQAAQLAADVAAIRFDKFFCSPMKRSIQTTELLNGIAQRPIHIVENLREWRVGDFERTTWENARIGAPLSEWENPPNGEPVAQFKQRIESALVDCLSRSEAPLISAHGAVGRMIVNILGIPDLHFTNCKVYRIFPVGSGETLAWSILPA